VVTRPPTNPVVVAKTSNSPSDRAASAATPRLDRTRDDSIPRYAYRTLEIQPQGDRAEAQRLVARGLQAQQAFRTTEAMDLYTEATRVDATLFEAHYNLGFLAFQEGQITNAIAAYETALAISPASVRARYNLALALDRAGFYIDAVRELEKVAATGSAEPMVHLALGNLYSERLRNPARAREHYERLLELEPRNPNATAIRFWLERN
jgi:tetratricopeptide (TPR) repeat protein